MSVFIISPSGNFYGSEQVLLEYLQSTEIKADVAVNENGLFFNILQKAKTVHNLSGFNPMNLRIFYWKVLKRLIKGKYSTIYWNEAGHINYCILLSKLFPRLKFVVHVRIIEDTVTERWIMKPGPNVLFVSVSEYIRQHLKYHSRLLYDPFKFDLINTPGGEAADILRIGVIGRLTFTKGIEAFTHLFSEIESRGIGDQYRFIFYGEVSDDVKNSDWLTKNSKYSFVEFEGFQKDRMLIYDSIDCVLHLSRQEALGRIFLEAIDAGKPMIGINAAGIGEIGNLLGLQDLLINYEETDLSGQILEKLKYVQMNKAAMLFLIADAKRKASVIFSPEYYVASVDKIISG